MKYDRFVRKCSNSNPKRSGPIHLKAPSKFFWRVVRGMMPHKSVYGNSALNRLACYEGVPAPYDKVKLVVVPQALKVLRKPHGRIVTRLGLLSSLIGWKHEKSLRELETKRKDKGIKRAKALAMSRTHNK
jgi:large subunit ribosomal protein L13Ae